MLDKDKQAALIRGNKKILEIIGISRIFIGTPKGIRTPDSAVRGRRLDPLTMGAYY